jgi:hypothetical protein
MYIIFKAVSNNQLGIVQTVGRVLNYAVGYIPESHVDVADFIHLKPIVVDENVALAWKFFGSYKNQISVRSGTLQNQQLQVISSGEADGTKVKYQMTSEDISNTVEFMKTVIRMMLDDIYDKRFVKANLIVSELEYSTWEQQRIEAERYLQDSTSTVPLITALALSRNISVEQMANKIITAINTYNNAITELLSNKQMIETEIKSCASIADCNRLLHNRFEMNMPVNQMTEEGIGYSSKLDL